MDDSGEELTPKSQERREFLKKFVALTAAPLVFTATKTFALPPLVEPLSEEFFRASGLMDLDPSLETEIHGPVKIINPHVKITAGNPPANYTVTVNPENVLVVTHDVAQLLGKSEEFEKALDTSFFTISLGEKLIPSPAAIAQYFTKSHTEVPRIVLPPSFLERCLLPKTDKYLNDPPEVVLAHEIAHQVCDIVDEPFPITNFEQIGVNLLTGACLGTILRNITNERRRFISFLMFTPFLILSQLSGTVSSEEQFAYDLPNKIFQNPKTLSACRNILTFQPSN
jgi:hypothetical protein